MRTCHDRTTDRRSHRTGAHANTAAVNCLSCHRSGDAQSGYSLSTRERLLKGGPRGVAVTPGKSAESLLYLTMTGDRNPRMPPDRDPTPEQLQLIKRWIDAGAHVDESKLK